MTHRKHRDRSERREEPPLREVAFDLAAKWIYMIYPVTGILLVLYPVRHLLHINYEIVGSAYPYFLGFPLIVMGILGARYQGRGVHG